MVILYSYNFPILSQELIPWKLATKELRDEQARESEAKTTRVEIGRVNDAAGNETGLADKRRIIGNRIRSRSNDRVSKYVMETRQVSPGIKHERLTRRN